MCEREREAGRRRRASGRLLRPDTAETLRDSCRGLASVVTRFFSSDRREKKEERYGNVL